ncbi:class I SAM-dependent methyltransferase [Engelhardtia mirabilis]|uniref:Malonyl-[acyl-carrier protein] O-methyltransferase n=1 Tax=Engelhardtia mirabilis TaxID=2528011 RepID=A0A518BQ12_9BACT|nr:Malonyl-[acyl-carrier protein] O-methyltransferase [Planctomycetes bacterium Pla133]QDV03389.1 Malonyl-[acyl-carrier protein] O-methyltransferase [Planctomycetes bacterium Pla86]
MIELPGLARSIPETALQDVPCGLCGSAARETKFTDGPFSVVTCSDCGLTYVTPRLADGALIDEVYNEGYWSSSAAKDRGYTDYRSDAPLYLRTYRKRLSVIRRHFARPGRVLDVGCAAGYFLSVMQSEGWDVTGLEPSDAIRPQAAERIGAQNVRAGLLGQVDLPKGHYDLITFWDVIEHIPDVVGALKVAREHLAPGGKLLIETQNVDSRAAAMLGKAWQHYKHAEHIYHFNPKTLGRVMDEAGFQVLENTPRLGGKYVSLGFVVERSQRLHPALSFVLSPLKLVAKSAVYVNLFDEMIVVAEPAS